MPVQVGDEEKWLSAPLEVVGKLQDEGGSNADSCGVVCSYFTRLLQSEETLAKVPLLNCTPLEQLADGHLVRYRGMVQDQFDPELYLKSYTAVNSSTGHQMQCSGIYRDMIDLPPGYVVDYESASNVTGDRHTLYCVPIPAQTEWVQHAYGQCGPPTTLTVSGNEATEHKPGVKRPLEECEEGGTEGGEGEMEVTGDIVDGETKKVKEEVGSAETSRSDNARRQNSRPDMNFPLPDESGLPCLLKVYGESVEALRVTSVVDCVGILSKHPHLTHFEGEKEDEMMGESAAERSAHCPPPSLVPRLHCVLVTTLHHCNPLLPLNLPRPLPREVYRSQFGGVARSRDLLLTLLTPALLGDRLAAEYSLLHLLSSVYGRTDMMALGRFSLNLTHCPGTASPPAIPLAPSLHNLLTQLLTQSVLLPLSLPVMNSWRFTPRKDYTANRLVAGALQLTAGTHLLVDETALKPGQLSEVGVQNLAALGHVIQQQTVTYDFQFHKTEFECDLPIMVLTEGKKSLLTLDCVVPLSPACSLPVSPTDQQLSEARVYLTLHRLLHYTLPADTQKVVEDDFVSMRKRDQTMTADRFHRLLCLARLVSLSYGCSELSLPHWDHAKHLETQRLARLDNPTVIN